MRRPHLPPITAGARYSVVFLFCLNFITAGGAYALASHNAASITQLCEAGNAHDAKEVQLWTRLIAISPPPPHETPAARAQRLALTQKFLAILKTLFAPQHC